jgi:hypothetical protein
MATNEKSHNVEFAKGGKTHMFSEQAAEPAEQGTTRDHSAKDSAPGAKFAAGGKGKMFGFTGALPAQGGITSAR